MYFFRENNDAATVSFPKSSLLFESITPLALSQERETRTNCAPMLKLFLLAALSLVLSGASWAQTATVQVGDAAPALAVVDANGKTHTVGELRGHRALLLTFFPRCFTGNCTSQLTSLRDAYPQLQKAGVEVWAVSTDGAMGPHGQRAFGKYLGLPFPLVPDPDRKLCLLFGAVRTKEQMAARMSVFIDQVGQVKWIDISPRTHGQDVLARVKAMQVASIR